MEWGEVKRPGSEREHRGISLHSCHHFPTALVGQRTGVESGGGVKEQQAH